MTGSKTQISPTDPLGWSHRAADIPERGLDTTRTAGDAELATLARALDIPACRSLTVSYQLRPIGGGRYRLSGEMSASVTQSCIVSLEPVEAELSETLDEEFWPEDAIEPAVPGVEGDEREALAHSAPEPIRQGSIEIGRVVYEQIATALDPYPRAADATFSWTEEGEAVTAKRDNPFAALEALKRKE